MSLRPGYRFSKLSQHYNIVKLSKMITLHIKLCSINIASKIWAFVSYKWLGRKEGNVLFNDALNTFYLRLYGIRHMVKDHTDSERGNPLPPHGLLFPINTKGSFICTIPQTGLHIPRPLLHQSWSTGWNENTSGLDSRPQD